MSRKQTNFEVAGLLGLPSLLGLPGGNGLFGPAFEMNMNARPFISFIDSKSGKLGNAR